MAAPHASPLDRLLLLPVRRPVATLVVALAMLGVGLWLLTRLDFNPRLESLLPADAKSAASLREITDRFELLDQAILFIEHLGGDGEADDDEERAAGELLAFAERFESALTSDSQAKPLVRAVEYRAPADLRRFIEEVAVPHALHYLDDDALQRLRDRLRPEVMQEQLARSEELLAAGSPAAAELAKQIARDPLRLYEIIGPALSALGPRLKTWRGGEAYLAADGRALLIRVEATGAPTNMTFTRDLMSALRRAVAAAEAGDLAIHYGGAYAIAETSEKGIRGDMIGSITGSIILLQLLYLFAYRKLSSFALIIAPVAWGIVIAFGVYSLFIGTISPISAGIGAMLAGMGDDFSIHYLSHFESCRRRGLSVEQSANLREGLGMSLFHACGTSIVGFLAISLSTVPALREFAILGSLGLAGALLGTVTVMPAILALLERRWPAQQHAALRFVPTMRDRFIRGARRWRVGAALLVIALVVLALRWDAGPWFGSEVHAMHPKPNAALETQERLAKRFGVSPETVFVHLRAGSGEGLVAASEQVVARLREKVAQDSIAAVIGPSTFVPGLEAANARGQTVLRDNEINAEKAVADFRSAVEASSFQASAFAAYEKFLGKLLYPDSVPGLNVLRRYPSLERMVLPVRASAPEQDERISQALVTIHLRQTPRDTIERDAMVDAIKAAIADVEGATVTGISVIGRELEHVVRRELPRMSLIAGLIVLVWVALLFRRPLDVAIAMAPALAAGLFMLAALRFVGDGLTMVNMAAVPILFGIAIDNGIFLVGAIPREARVSHAEVAGLLAERCHAISVSTVTTILAFGSLMVASVPAMVSLGLALTAGMVGCWLASIFLVIPLLMRRVEEGNDRAAPREAGTC